MYQGGEHVEHYYNIAAVLFFILLYGGALLFLPFYNTMQKKPAKTYSAFVIAFAIEMHGIPFTLFLITTLFGRQLPYGILWGHTLFQQFGYLTLYLNCMLALLGFGLIIRGWSRIYHGYWKHVKGSGALITNGIYKTIRHPQYTGLMCIALGMVIGWATLPTLLLFPIIIARYINLAQKEERLMLEEFGDEYYMYMTQTKKFIPYIY
jgi:protein-S-isoprenylcysteine O-methyltransferase Ste14